MFFYMEHLFLYLFAYVLYVMLYVVCYVMCQKYFFQSKITDYSMLSHDQFVCILRGG